ncbi:CRE-SPE-4 protein [Caenorhabditis remanei]|uniref:CRE-SPE-4 protein n=1 Tax=Caenorhabditis remanei TaxID=31234 RepID=E3N426_CAERE|nr:CRE-SPE-4 protein [Caenorhabditis remanei]
MLRQIYHEFRRSSQLQWTLFSVIVNMSLTLSIWIGIYQMQVNSELSKLYFLDDSFERTTGNTTLDGLINGFATILVLGCVSFVMLAFVLYDFQRVVKAWLTLSCMLILFGVSGQTLYDLFTQILDQNDENQYILTVALTVIPTTIYGVLGIYAFFANGSLALHQFFVISNCSLISVFYLRAFPRYTTWFVLWMVLFWDLFAVLAPMGPLKKVQEKASDYSNNILKFLMFAAEDKRETAGIDATEDSSENLNDERKLRKDVKQLIELYSKKEAQDDEFLRKIRQRRTAINPDSALTETSPVHTEPSDALIQLKSKNSDEEHTDDESDTTESSTTTSSSDVTTSEVSTAEEVAPEEWNELMEQQEKQAEFDQRYVPVTAADALNDGETVRLGFGDFVFYSLLIGQTATGGSALAVACSALGILFGLVATLTVFSSGESTTPALPLPVICGTFCYFISKFVVDQVYG